MRQVNLPAELCETAEKRFCKQFGSFEEFLIFVLGELVRDDAERMDRNERRMIEERLKGLGYL
jgi:hypothetical protein